MDPVCDPESLLLKNFMVYDGTFWHCYWSKDIDSRILRPTRVPLLRNQSRSSLATLSSPCLSAILSSCGGNNRAMTNNHSHKRQTLVRICEESWFASNVDTRNPCHAKNEIWMQYTQCSSKQKQASETSRLSFVSRVVFPILLLMT